MITVNFDSNHSNCIEFSPVRINCECIQKIKANGKNRKECVEGDIADTAAHFRHRCRDPFSFSN